MNLTSHSKPTSALFFLTIFFPSFLFFSCGETKPPAQVASPVDSKDFPPSSSDSKNGDTQKSTSTATSPQPLSSSFTPDDPFRNTAPISHDPIQISVPVPTSFRLKNGIQVHVVERHDLPIVSVSIISRGGYGDPAIKPGLASFTTSLLESGTSKKTAEELAQMYESLGSMHHLSVSADAVVYSLKSTSASFLETLDLAAEVLREPSFPAREFDLLKRRRLALIEEEKNSPQHVAMNVAVNVMYGRKSPYGHSPLGEPKDVEYIDLAMVKDAYSRLFDTREMAIVLAGDVKPKELGPLLEQRFGGWKTTRPTKPAPRLPAQESGSRLFVVDKPGAPQTQMLVLQHGYDVFSKKRVALEILNTIFGGNSLGRINKNLREKNGYTYGAYSVFIPRANVGLFAILAAVNGPKTKESVTETISEIQRIRVSKVSSEELEIAKKSALLSVRAAFETTEDLSSGYGSLFSSKLPISEFEDKRKRIPSLSEEDIYQAAQSFFDPKQIRVILVGDMQKIAPSLSELHLGEPQFYDAYGNKL